MPRTKGAKNKPHTIDWHLAELKKLGIEKSTWYDDKNADLEEGKKAHIHIKKKEKFEIEKPQEKEKENESNLDDIVIRCGNPKCGKILDSEYSKCPFCSCGLTWN